MKSKFKYALVPVFLLLALATVGASSAYTTHNLNSSTYSTYFNSTGYLNHSTVNEGDVLDLTGNITNKNMTIDLPINITSSNNSTLINGRIKILSSGTNVTNLNVYNTNSGLMGIFLLGTEVTAIRNCTIQGNYIRTCGHYG